MVDDNGEV